MPRRPERLVPVSLQPLHVSLSRTSDIYLGGSVELGAEPKTRTPKPRPVAAQHELSRSRPKLPKTRGCSREFGRSESSNLLKLFFRRTLRALEGGVEDNIHGLLRPAAAPREMELRITMKLNLPMVLCCGGDPCMMHYERDPPMR